MRGLSELLDHREFREALAYDLICLGLRLRDLGTSWFTWGDLLAIVRQQPPHSALNRAVDPDASMWGLPEQLLAALVDVTSMQLWADHNGRRGQKPKPIPRPGVEPDKTTTTWGTTESAMSIDDFDDWLAGELTAA